MAELLPIAFHGDTAAGILAGIDFAPDQQTRLDLLTAAHMQCQAASVFIANQYDEVRGHD